MNKKGFFLTAIALATTLTMNAYDLGVIGGFLSQPGEAVLGFSGGMRLIVPGLKLELEVFEVAKSPDHFMSAGIKFNPKVGKIGLYGMLGVGTDFEKLNFDFSQYRAFTFLGFGIHVYLVEILSLRGDVRFYNYSDINRNRISAGLFLHL